MLWRRCCLFFWCGFEAAVFLLNGSAGPANQPRRIGPQAPPRTLGVAMEGNLDHRTDPVEDLAGGRDQRNVELHAFWDREDLNSSSKVDSDKGSTWFVLKCFNCQDVGLRRVSGRRNRRGKVERGRPERRSNRSVLAHRTVPAIVGSSFFQAVVLLTLVYGCACHEM